MRNLLLKYNGIMCMYVMGWGSCAVFAGNGLSGHEYTV